MFPLKERYRMHVDNYNWGEFNYNGEANPSNSLTQQHIQDSFEHCCESWKMSSDEC